MQSLKILKEHRSKRILCVDDEEFCIASMSVLLHKSGVDVNSDVDFCINGKEAIEMARLSQEFGFTYKLVLTDFNMPVMDGLEATKGLRHILGDGVPIVGITGYASNKYHTIGK